MVFNGYSLNQNTSYSIVSLKQKRKMIVVKLYIYLEPGPPVVTLSSFFIK